MFDDAIKTWLYAGAPCAIRHVQSLTDEQFEEIKRDMKRYGPYQSEAHETLSQLNKGHYCGYVQVPFVLTEEQIYEVDVHGGITYIGESQETAIYGFDCGHYMDTIEHWTLERVTQETERLFDNILKVVKDATD